VLADQIHDLSGVRMATLLLLREHTRSVDVNFEDAALGWCEVYRCDGVLVLVEDFGRQTDGAILIASNGAVFDLDVHRSPRRVRPVRLC